MSLLIRSSTVRLMQLLAEAWVHGKSEGELGKHCLDIMSEIKKEHEALMVERDAFMKCMEAIDGYMSNEPVIAFDIKACRRLAKISLSKARGESKESGDEA